MASWGPLAALAAPDAPAAPTVLAAPAVLSWGGDLAILHDIEVTPSPAPDDAASAGEARSSELAPQTTPPQTTPPQTTPPQTTPQQNTPPNTARPERSTFLEAAALASPPSDSASVGPLTVREGPEGEVFPSASEDADSAQADISEGGIARGDIAQADGTPPVLEDQDGDGARAKSQGSGQAQLRGSGGSARSGNFENARASARQARLIEESYRCADLFPYDAAADLAVARVHVELDAGGRPTAVRVDETLPQDPAFSAAASTCAKRLRFAPAVSTLGSPLASSAELKLRFSRHGDHRQL